MTRSGECCGWLSWAEQAGIGADGAPLRDSANNGTPSVPSPKLEPSYVTAALRRVLDGSTRRPR